VLGVWLGSVPILIPLAWFMMIYPSYVLANLIADGRPVAVAGSAWHLLGLAALGALVMTAWDLVVDPILSGPAFRAWVWEQGGGYFGIPAQNYLGWLVTTFTVYVLYRFAERRWPPKPADPLSGAAALPPVLAYAAMLSANVLTGGLPAGVIAVAVIAMGMPIVAALIAMGRLRERPQPG
jgi:putative membrane protein